MNKRVSARQAIREHDSDSGQWRTRGRWRRAAVSQVVAGYPFHLTSSSNSSDSSWTAYIKDGHFKSCHESSHEWRWALAARRGKDGYAHTHIHEVAINSLNLIEFRCHCNACCIGMLANMGSGRRQDGRWEM